MFEETFFRNSWGHATKHIIVGDYIVESGPREYYNPWLYMEAVDPIIIKEIFGKKRSQPIALHAAFASIDMENIQQVLAWCNHFGFPEYRQGRYSLFDFECFVTEFYFLFFVSNAMHYQTEADIEKIMNVPLLLEESANIPSEVKEQIKEYIRQDPVQAANKYITGKMNKRMKENFWPEFQSCEGKEIKLTWRTTSLACVMHFMFGMAITSGFWPLKCNNKNCTNYFIPKNERNIYCSIECKNHAQQRRLQTERRNQRIDDAIKAYHAGIPIKEAAKLYSVTVPALQKALQGR